MEIILFIIFAIVIVIVGGGFYLGFFSKIDVHERQEGPFKLVYKDYQGPYKNTAAIQDEIYETLLDKGLETYRGFGIYYDDPKKTSPEELRSKAGCIVEEKDYDNLQKIDHAFEEMTVDQKNYLLAEFPYKRQISIMLGIMKVYPALDKYIEKNNYEQREIMEIYDVPNKKILYLMPIDK